MSLTSIPSEFARRTPCSRSSRSMRMSVSRIRAPMNSRAFKQHALVGHAGSVVDAVVDREPVAEILEQRAARRAGDHAEARDDQALEEDLHHEHLFLERVRVEHLPGELVEVRIALGHPPRLLDQLQPGLGVARLVLHHRRVVELRLAVRGDREELRRHLDGELVRL